MLRRDVPVIELATRGLVGFELKVQTGARDLHSGMYGGVALNAIHVLLRCLDAVLAGPDGRLPEPLREGIATPTADELEAWSKLPPGAESLSEAGRAAARRKSGRGVLSPCLGGAVGRRERDPRRQARRPEHDAQRVRLRPSSRSASRRGRRRRRSGRPQSGCCARRRRTVRSSRSPGSARTPVSSARTRRRYSSRSRRSSRV